MAEKLQQMQRRSFECWRSYGKWKLTQRRATHKAVYSYNVRLEQKVINSMLKNCIEAKGTRSVDANLSKDMLDALTNFNRKRILKKTFRSWFGHTVKLRRIKDLSARICALGKQLYLNKYIEAWKINCLEKKENAEKDKKANELYRNSLQRKILRIWIDRHGESLFETKKWNDAILHSRLKLLKTIWLAWIRYSNVGIEKANKIEGARYFHKSQLLRKSFEKLASNVTKRRAKRTILEISINRYEKILLRRVLRSWINYHRRLIDINLHIEMRCKRLENSLKKKMFWQLRRYVWIKKCNRRRYYNSMNHHKRKVTEKAIFVMKSYVLYRKEKAIRLLYLNNAVVRILYELENVYIATCRSAVICHTRERQKICRVQYHSSARSMKCYFSIWKVYSERFKIVAKRKRTLCEIGSTVLLKKYTTLWIKEYTSAVLVNENEKRATAIFGKKLKIRFFNYWRIYVDGRNRVKMEIDEAKKFHRKYLLREGLKKVLRICLYKSESRYEKRLKAVKTNCFEDFEIKRQFFGKLLRARDFAQENRKSKSSNTLKTKRVDTYEIPYRRSLSRRFVLPDYMKRNTSNIHDKPSEISLSGSYESSDLSSGTYTQ